MDEKLKEIIAENKEIIDFDVKDIGVNAEITYADITLSTDAVYFNSQSLVDMLETKAPYVRAYAINSDDTILFNLNKITKIYVDSNDFTYLQDILSADRSLKSVLYDFAGKEEISSAELNEIKKLIEKKKELIELSNTENTDEIEDGEREEENE